MNYRYPLFFLAALLSIGLIGCKKSSNSEENTMAEFEMALSADDTIKVNSLLTKYLDHVVACEYDSAVGMLYEYDITDKDYMPYKIPEYKREHIRTIISTFPIQRYVVGKPVFRNYAENDVEVKVFIDDIMSTTWKFRPVRYLGEWFLTLNDTSGEDFL